MWGGNPLDDAYWPWQVMAVAFLTSGMRFGHLRIERELGRGAFAVVYLAEDTRLDRRVALKALSPGTIAGSTPDQLEQFRAEARLVARLNNPHVVTLFQMHEESGPEGTPTVLLEMEYVEGGTLEDGASGALPPDAVTASLRGILSGLGAAHAAGVLHRDIKPANILVSDRGEAKLTDFGLARMMGDEINLDDGAHGTPLYMAPELLRGGTATVQSDLWSVGVVAYRLLAGRHPFPTDDAATFFAAVQNEAPLALPAIVPEPLQSLVSRCLAKDPTERPETCDEALGLLNAAPMVASPPPRAPEPTPPLYGRATELAALERAAESRGGGRVLLVTGAPGIGKTALCMEAGRAARARRALWIDARLSGLDGPFTTLLELARAQVASVGRRSGQRRDRGPDPDAPLIPSQQAVWELRQLLHDLTTERTLVLCIDDAQFATEDDVQSLSRLARALAGRPFLLILVSRPNAPATAALEDAERLVLGPLPDEALFAMLEDRLGTTIPGHVAMSIVCRVEGNPLRALELARHLESTGAIERTERGLHPSPTWTETSLPARLQDLIHARLSSLDAEERALLEVAAVDGVEFEGQALAAVLQESLLAVLRRLQRLCTDRTLIASAEQGYRFADRATQEVLYDALGPELRTALHHALASHLETRDDAVDPARLARHWERAGDIRRAGPYLIRLADRARLLQEGRKFLELAERAGLLDEEPPIELLDEFELAVDLATALVQRGRCAEGEALWERLLAGADARESAILRARIEVMRAHLNLTHGKREDRDPAYWERCAEMLKGSVQGALAHAILGRMAKFRGDLAAARTAFETSAREAEAIGHRSSWSTALEQLGSVALRSHRLDEARGRYAQAARVAEEAGLAIEAAICRTNGSLAGMLSGVTTGVDADLRRSIRVFDLFGSTDIAAHARIYLAEALFAKGNTADALSVLEEAVPTLEQSQRFVARTNALRLRAELLAVLGKLDEAAYSIARALECAAHTSDRREQILAHAVDALIATGQGRAADARRAVAAVRAASLDYGMPAAGIFLALCEAVRFGLPHEELASLGPIESEEERLLRDGTLRLARGESIAEPLGKLRSMRIGLRAASYGLLSAWIEAEAAPLEEREKKMTAALEAAVALGHVRAVARLAACGE